MTEQPSFHRICSVDIDGGFLDRIRIDFDDNLNCLIGGRGTGKTSILELLRWALGQMPDPIEAKELHKKITQLVKANLEDGQISVAIETSTGIRYTVQRTFDSDPIVLGEKGDPVDIQIGRGTIFSAEVYSQSQIEEIANDPRFQLKLIDKFISAEIDEIEDKIAAGIRELSGSSSEILNIIEELTNLSEKIAELPEVTEKLKAYQADEGDEEAKVLQAGGQAKTLREREKRTLERIQQLFIENESQLRDLSSKLLEEIVQQVPQAILEGPNAELFKEVERITERGAQAFKSKTEEAVQSAEETRRDLEDKSQEVSSLHISQEKAYQELLQKHEKEKGRAKERDQLLKRQSGLQEDAKKFDNLRERLAAKQQKRQKRLASLSELKDERFTKRQAVAAELTNKLSPSIRVHIEQEGNTDLYQERLTAALKGCGFQYKGIASRIVRNLPPVELAALVQTGKKEAFANLSDQLEMDSEKIGRIVQHLKDGPEIFAIEIIEMHDRPTIELKDGSNYKDSTALSTGQKCTTILPILLLESASPLLIDQPEDNLDNAYIFETVVKSIRAVQGRRQLIFVTHNPNIPVLGDAQKVVVLKSTGQRASIKGMGTVDEVKAEIENVLEGGREAFRCRKERYGY